MVNSEEVVERTFYISLLNVLLKNGLTLNPEDYLPLSPQNEKRFLEDMNGMKKFIPLWGVSNNQVKGPKTLPRITLELQGYYSGDIGIEKYIIGDKLEDGNYQSSEFPYETKDITIDVHLVSQTQADMRLLHNILYTALPSRGYIRPYFNDLEEWEEGRIAPTGNLFIEIGNYYDHPDVEHGILEKVYTYTCKDGILPEKALEDGALTPIKDISVLMGLVEQNEKDMLELKVPNQ